MVKITIDCNNDIIEVQSDGGGFTDKIKEPSKICEILNEIFSRIDWNNPNPDVTLTKIDEDNSTTVGEW